MTSISNSKISYGTWQQGLRGYPDFLRWLTDDEHPASLCDVGSGAAPALTPAEAEQYGTSYPLLDVSQSGLDKSPSEFEKICADATDPGLPTDVARRFDKV